MMLMMMIMTTITMILVIVVISARRRFIEHFMFNAGGIRTGALAGDGPAVLNSQVLQVPLAPDVVLILRRAVEVHSADAAPDGLVEQLFPVGVFLPPDGIARKAW